MTLHYADASAWAKLIVEEPESDAMLDHLASVRESGGSFVASQLLETELYQLAARMGLPRRHIGDALREISLVCPNSETFQVAGRLPGESLRSLDAIHIAAAIDCDVDAFITYDLRQAGAAQEAGFTVITPKP